MWLDCECKGNTFIVTSKLNQPFLCASVLLLVQSPSAALGLSAAPQCFEAQQSEQQLRTFFCFASL
jgi:hypothetical protein